MATEKFKETEDNFAVNLDLPRTKTSNIS